MTERSEDQGRKETGGGYTREAGGRLKAKKRGAAVGAKKLLLGDLKRLLSPARLLSLVLLAELLLKGHLRHIPS